MVEFNSPPIRTEFPQQGTPNLFSRPWAQWFQSITNRFNAAPPVITGSRGGNVALANLLTALDQAGIVKDQTT